MPEEIPTAREQSLAWSDSPDWPSCLDAAQIRYRRKWARSKRRFWYYDRASRQPIAESPAWPWFGGDEYGRKTLVIPIPFHGEFVWAFWMWKDKDDDEIREHTYQQEKYEQLRTKEFEDTYILVGEMPFIDVRHNIDDCDLRWAMYYEGDPEERIPCAAYPLAWDTLRFYPIYDTEATVTVRVEVGESGTGITCIKES